MSEMTQAGSEKARPSRSSARSKTSVAPTIIAVIALACVPLVWRNDYIISLLTLILLYSTSTLYHSVRGRTKVILRKLDHLSIYLLIAGSYTPFCLVTLRGPWGWTLFGVVWTLALLGILQDLRQRSGPRILSVVIYITMGWVALVALAPLLQALGYAGFAWLAAGGLFYTIGIIFYALDTRLRHAHGVWHLFVIAGSATHYIAVLRYVL